MRLKFLNLTNLTLLVALAISTVAAYYSIIGLTAIFAGAFIPVIIMGSILEVGKITTTVWLRKYWHRCSWVLKMYLVPAVVALALLTSMGIFGFLSKAHMETGLVSGEVQTKLTIIDEKIKTERDNIDIARKALAQMDAQVDARLSRGESEAGAERAVQIRRQQATERAKLQKEIATAQKNISTLNEERAPIAAENRKVEAEVGPIKYIAALIYGDTADNNTLEAAVRWVIILLVIVFDPLAIALVLAANSSKEWDKEDSEETLVYVADVGEKPTMEEKAQYEPDDGPLTSDQVEQLRENVTNSVEEKSILEQHPYLTAGFSHFKGIPPMVHKPEPTVEVEGKPKVEKKKEKVVKKAPPMITAVKQKKATTPKKTPKNQSEEVVVDVVERPGDYITPEDTSVIIQPKKPYEELDSGYIIFEGKQMKLDALKEMRPDLFKLTADNVRPVNTSFGISFPSNATKGELFVRVDMLPNRVYKYDGVRWIEVNKEKTDTYLFNDKYLQYLVDKIDRGEYDVDLLSDHEKDQIEEYLRTK